MKSSCSPPTAHRMTCPWSTWRSCASSNRLRWGAIPGASLWRRSEFKEDAITRSSTITGLIAASAIALGGAQALAASANDWPCVQRRVATVTSAQMWDGPDVDDLTQWRDNDEMKKLIALLISRRVPLDQATNAIAQFAAAQQPNAR